MPRSKTPWKPPAARHAALTPAEVRAWLEERDGTVAQLARVLGKNIRTARRYVDDDYTGPIPAEVELAMRLSKYEPDLLRNTEPFEKAVTWHEKRKLERANVGQN